MDSGQKNLTAGDAGRVPVEAEAEKHRRTSRSGLPVPAGRSRRTLKLKPVCVSHIVAESAV